MVQLPGTLPFKDVKPHSSDAMEDLVQLFSDRHHRGKTERSDGNSVDQSNEEMDLGKEDEDYIEPPRIGKLRVMKSGRVVMRIQLPGSQEYVDLEVNKGI